MADDPQDELLAVAREIIEKRGYLGLSMRTAAAAAGVTEQVARRYFRNRDALFAAALRLPVDPASAIPTLVAPGLEGMGERLVRFTLDVLKDPQARDELLSLARTGAHAGHAALGIQDFLERGVVDRVATAIGVPDARMRSALISSYLLGIAMSRYVVRLEPLASASEEEVVRMVAPVIQDLLDPRHPIPGSTRARAASREQRASTAETAAGQRVPPPPEARPAAAAPPPKPFDPDPGRSTVSSAELLGMGAANLSATTMHVAANALRAAAVAASRASAQPSPSRPRGGSGAADRSATPTPRPTSPAASPAAKSGQATERAAAATSAAPRKRAATAPTTKAPTTGTRPAKAATTAAKPAPKPSTTAGSSARKPASKSPASATKTPAEKTTAAKKATTAKKSTTAKKTATSSPESRTPAKRPAGTQGPSTDAATAPPSTAKASSRPASPRATPTEQTSARPRPPAGTGPAGPPGGEGKYPDA